MTKNKSIFTHHKDLQDFYKNLEAAYKTMFYKDLGRVKKLCFFNKN